MITVNLIYEPFLQLNYLIKRYIILLITICISIDVGLFDWLAGLVSDFLSTSMNTLGTNILQCLDEGPRIIQTQLDLELNTPKPGIVRTTPETIESAVRTISGNTISLFHYKLWISI